MFLSLPFNKVLIDQLLCTQEMWEEEESSFQGGHSGNQTFQAGLWNTLKPR